MVVLLWQSGCVITPDTDRFDFPEGETRLSADETVALLSVELDDESAPGCAEETLRRHLPEGTNLDPVMFGERVKTWLSDDNGLPIVSRITLREAVIEAGGDPSTIDPELRYLVTLHGYNKHDEHSGVLDGAGVIAAMKIDHTTFISVSIFDLDTGMRNNHWRINSRGERYYGIAGIFPIIGYSDTAGSVCDELDEALRQIVDGTSG